MTLSLSGTAQILVGDKGLMKSHHRNIFSLALLFVLSFPLTIKSALAQDSLTEQEKALNIIADFAERLCNEIPLSGEIKSYELSGKAKVELSGIIKVLGLRS